MQRVGLLGKQRCSEPPAPSPHGPQPPPGQQEKELSRPPAQGTGGDEGRKMRSWGKRTSLVYSQTPTARDTGEPHAQACGRAALGREDRAGGASVVSPWLLWTARRRHAPPVSSGLSGCQPLGPVDPEVLRGTIGLSLPGRPGHQTTEAPTPPGLFCFHFFGYATWLSVSYCSYQGMNPGPGQQRCRVLTTGPSGNSPPLLS